VTSRSGKKGSIPLHDDTQKDNERNMSWHYNTPATTTGCKESELKKWHKEKIKWRRCCYHHHGLL